MISGLQIQLQTSQQYINILEYHLNSKVKQKLLRAVLGRETLALLALVQILMLLLGKRAKLNLGL